MDFPELARRPLNSFQGPSPRRTRHRVDAGEPRGCFSVFHTNSSMDYTTQPSPGNRLFSEFSQQQLLREMLERRPKLGFEESFDDRAVKINGCKKRKLYQPLRNGGEIQEPEPMSGGGGGPDLQTRRGSLSPNNFLWGNGKRSLSPLSSPQPKPTGLHQPFPHLPSLHQWKESFKAHLLGSVADLVDSQFQTFFQSLPPLLPPLPPPQQQQQQQQLQQHAGPLKMVPNQNNHRFFKPSPTPQLPPNPHFTSALLHLNNNYQASRDDCDSPLSLVVSPKKKRHKVTDTRLTPRAVSRLLDAGSGPTYIDESPGYFNSNYSSPPASLKEFMQSQIGAGSGGSPSGAESDGSISNDDSNLVGPISGSSATLTPMHLRKAKLMFFWVRYPSSAVLKMYFPDIKFNKNNTAQLVKWFSNFREFYYIQMEKYARQALSEGVKNAEEIHVSVDHELYRVLNLHYNRNNHIEVPTNFRFVVEQTLREFLKAIQMGKDSEQSWKKAIYKIIARLDDPVPDYFKSPNFLEQLE